MSAGAPISLRPEKVCPPPPPQYSEPCPLPPPNIQNLPTPMIRMRGKRFLASLRIGTYRDNAKINYLRRRSGKKIPMPRLCCSLARQLDYCQGGESRDLYCTYIRTEGVIKLFNVFLILNEFTCRKVEIPCLYSQRMNFQVL